MKKKSIGILALTATLCLSAGTFASCKDDKNAAATVFTVDVNPSVEISLNKNDEVVATAAINADGEALLAKAELKGMSFELAMDNLTRELKAEGKLGENSNSLLISFSKASGESIKTEVKNQIVASCEKYEIDASVLSQTLSKVTEEVKELSASCNVSIGKAQLAVSINAEFPAYNVEELVNDSITNLSLLFDGISQEAKAQFDKIGETLSEYKTADEAKEIAYLDAKTDKETVKNSIAYISFEKNEEETVAYYNVYFVVENTAYSYVLNAKTGEIVENTSYALPDIDALVQSYIEQIKSATLNAINDWQELIKKVSDTAKVTHAKAVEKAAALVKTIDNAQIVKTDIQLVAGENYSLYTVTLKTKNNDVYVFEIEASTGIVISAKKNNETNWSLAISCVIDTLTK